jgi:hypothetical protein
VALPAKGCVLDLSSEIACSDDVFDVALTSDCMGAAVLIYELVDTLTCKFVDTLATFLGATLKHPFGMGVGLAYIETPTLGRAVLRYGSREIRLTLLLSTQLGQRGVFEEAMVQASQLEHSP